MANTRFGNFSDLSQGKKPMDAQEAWLMLKQLGLLGQEFVPGATSIRKVMEGKPMEAVDELVDWIPEGRAVQKFVDNEDQDWTKNAIDAMIIGKPLSKGAKKAFEAIEKVPKGGKEGFVQAVFLPKQNGKAILVKPKTQEELKQFNEALDIAEQKGQISADEVFKMKNNAKSDLKEQQAIQYRINLGDIDPNFTAQNINKLKAEDVDPDFIQGYNIARAVGNRHKVNEYPRGRTKFGNVYYTTGDNGRQLLYSENAQDANTAKHMFTDYPMKYNNAVKDIIESYPNIRNPRQYGYIKDKTGNNRNAYKSVVEPTMFEKRVPLRTLENSDKSINEGKRALEENPLYMTPEELLMFMTEIK